jgi:virginiamycin B lyase
MEEPEGTRPHDRIVIKTSERMDGLWFTEYDGDKIGRINPLGTIKQFHDPHRGKFPGGITAGPDGRIWFTEGDGNKIGGINL